MGNFPYLSVKVNKNGTGTINNSQTCLSKRTSFTSLPSYKIRLLFSAYFYNDSKAYTI